MHRKQRKQKQWKNSAAMMAYSVWNPVKIYSLHRESFHIFCPVGNNILSPVHFGRRYDLVHHSWRYRILLFLEYSGGV